MVKKTTTKKNGSQPKVEFNYVPPKFAELGFQAPEYIRCRICCAEVVHLSFEWECVATSTSLRSIKKAIWEWHGGTISRISLFLERALPACMISGVEDEDETRTLATAGVKGVPADRKDARPLVTILYLFSAHQISDCPIVNAEPFIITSKYLRPTLAQLHPVEPPSATSPAPHSTPSVSQAAPSVLSPAPSNASEMSRQTAGSRRYSTRATDTWGVPKAGPPAPRHPGGLRLAARASMGSGGAAGLEAEAAKAGGNGESGGATDVVTEG